MSLTLPDDYEVEPEILARYQNKEDELAELCQFWKFSYLPESGYQGTCVFEMIDEDTGEPLIRSVRVHPSKPVEVWHHLPPDGQVSVHVTMPYKMLSDVFWGRVTAKEFLFDSSVSVHGWAYASLRSFSLSFDSSTPNWRRYYKWKDEKEARERAAQEQLKESVILNGTPVSSSLVSNTEDRRRRKKLQRQRQQLRKSVERTKSSWIGIFDGELDEWVQKSDFGLDSELEEQSTHHNFHAKDSDVDGMRRHWKRPDLLFSKMFETLPMSKSDEKDSVRQELPSISDSLPKQMREIGESHCFDRLNRRYYRSPFSMLSLRRNRQELVAGVKQSVHEYPHYLALSLDDCFNGNDHDFLTLSERPVLRWNHNGLIRLLRKNQKDSDGGGCISSQSSSLKSWVPTMMADTPFKSPNNPITQYLNRLRPDILHLSEFI